MREDEHTTHDYVQNNTLSAKETYTYYSIRIRNGSLAAQGLLQHTQRFHYRYGAGWLSTLIEEFYVLLNGPDPRASLLYPLLYRHMEPAMQLTPTPVLPPKRIEGEQAEEGETDMMLAELQEMSENLKGYFAAQDPFAST